MGPVSSQRPVPGPYNSPSMPIQPPRADRESGGGEDGEVDDEDVEGDAWCEYGFVLGSSTYGSALASLHCGSRARSNIDLSAGDTLGGGKASGASCARDDAEPMREGGGRARGRSDGEDVGVG